MENNLSLRKLCFVSSGFEEDRFVGIKIISGKPEIHFPICFSISESDAEIRKDIIALIDVLKRFKYSDDRNGIQHKGIMKDSGFPFLSYQRLLLRYLNYGAYKETESIYSKKGSGKINWSRTIKTTSPYYSEQGPIYINPISKITQPQKETLFEKIYLYCIFCAFQAIGWLYTSKVFPNPHIQFNKSLFLATIREKLEAENNDTAKEMIWDMSEIIKCQSNKGYLPDKIFGTYEFEYVWEKMIDYAFGEPDKNKYFPRTYWTIIKSGEKTTNHALQPDTVMSFNNDIYILDAKYYRFGLSENAGFLPDSSSINKQITYGEYLSFNAQLFGINTVYNAFLLPGNVYFSSCGEHSVFSYFGFAESNWKSGNLPHEKVAGILVDTKQLLYSYSQKTGLKNQLADLIKTKSQRS